MFNGRIFLYINDKLFVRDKLFSEIFLELSIKSRKVLFLLSNCYKI